MKALLLALLVSWPAAAERSAPELVLHTTPPGLKVYAVPLDDNAELSALGNAGKPLAPVAGRSVTVRFGYGNWVAPEQHTIDLADPPAQPFVVELPWTIWFRYHHLERWLVLLGLTGAIAAMAGLRRVARRGRELRLAQRLAALEAVGRAEDPNLFRTVAGYRLVGRLGAGGMAVVYRALPEATLVEEEAVAVKLMLCDSQTDRQRFRREADVSSRLMHPNIVRIHDAGDQDGQLYLVMELVRGGTLRGRPPGGNDFWSVFEPILKALEHAHGQGVVHRDLKPDNVMVTERGRVVVMDFGLAVRPDSVHVTAQGSLLGTPAYMSPEQIRNLPLDGRSDQYALGVMACEMLTGHSPYGDCEDPMAQIMRHLQDEPALPPDLEPAVQAVLRKMLAKAPEDRYPDLRACREDWQRAL